MKICRNALLLVKSMGLPGLVEGEAPPPHEALRLLQLAKLNKLPLLFVESLRKFRHLPVEDLLLHYRDKHEKTLNLVTTISSLLKKFDIRYTIFKTLKPFPYAPADIDILLWSSKDLTNASQILKKRGLKTLDKDPYGLTMLSVDNDLNVDLTTEVAVSSFIYLDKNLLFSHIDQVKVDDCKVYTLKPYAELVTTAAHCMYKEQMYTLSDYYTFALSSQYYQKSLELAEAGYAKFPLETALRLTYDITVTVFGTGNFLIKKLRTTLKTSDVNVVMQNSKCLDLPVRYPSYILLKGFSEKILEDPISRNSLPKALRSTLQPKFINKLMEHITRKTY